MSELGNREREGLRQRSCEMNVDTSDGMDGFVWGEGRGGGEPRGLEFPGKSELEAKSGSETRGEGNEMEE